MTTRAEPVTVLLNDITLRDGEQMPGVNFYPEEKLRIARQLARLAVPIIEAGFAIASDADFRGIELIARELGDDDRVICSMARAAEKDIDAAARALAAARRPRIQIVLATSDLHLERKLGMTRTQALDLVPAMVTHARLRVDDVEFAAEDATRSDPAFLRAVCLAAVDAGASTIELPDTVGYATPDEYATLVRNMVRALAGRGVVIATHCHDDLGLAVANTLAGIAAGARQAECTVNGIGERAGNAALEEVVMALCTRFDLFGLPLDLDTTQLAETSRLVAELAGVTPPPNKAIVGANAFVHASGIHQHGILRDRRTYQIIDPAAVGARPVDLQLGKLSGKHALRARLEALGIALDAALLDAVYVDFKDLAARKKIIVDQDLRQLAARMAAKEAATEAVKETAKETGWSTPD
jgi:2-isopropylmalate synthase